jgi:hypothetical protein
MLRPFSLILLLHIATFISILCLARIVLIKLREVTPRLEVVPILVKLVDLIYWSRTVSNVWHWLFLCKERVSLEYGIKHLIEISFRDSNNVFLTGNAIIEGQTRIIALSFNRVYKRFVCILY